MRVLCLKLALIPENLETAKNVFTKRDPDLATFYEQEAQPVAIPIFGQNRNLTVTGQLDPSTAALVRVAAESTSNARRRQRRR